MVGGLCGSVLESVMFQFVLQSHQLRSCPESLVRSHAVNTFHVMSLPVTVIGSLLGHRGHTEEWESMSHHETVLRCCRHLTQNFHMAFSFKILHLTINQMWKSLCGLTETKWYAECDPRMQFETRAWPMRSSQSPIQAAHLLCAWDMRCGNRGWHTSPFGVTNVISKLKLIHPNICTRPNLLEIQHRRAGPCNSWGVISR